MKNVLVIFGGVSSEHDVSLVSARSVIENIPKDKYKLTMLGITKDGRWLHYSGKAQNLPDGKWLEDTDNTRPAMLSADHKQKGLFVFKPDGSLERMAVDIVFPVLHGKNGEDGTIQGLLELAGLPFVGCGTLSSAMCMDKAVSNILADSFGIAQAKWMSLLQNEYEAAADEVARGAAKFLGFPIFVKPANAGSSVGVSKARNIEQLHQGLKEAFLHDRKLVLEENIDGMEVECAVLGNDKPIASIPGEVVPSNDFYDYEAKYISASSELHIPARLPQERFDEIKAAAIKVYKALDCAGMARVDFFVRKIDGALMFNELNTIPGFTSISMYPKMFEASGISYPDLLDRLLQLACQR